MPVVKAIKKAKKTIDIVIFRLDRTEIEKALEKMVFNNLYTFFKAGTYDRPYRDPELVNKIESHKQVALRTAEEAITLLKNEGNILPLKGNKIVVLGTDEALTMYTGKGSGNVSGYDVVDYLAGLRKVYGEKIIRQAAISNESRSPGSDTTPIDNS